MESNLFKSLKQCDAKTTWALVREIVGVQLLGEDVITIPYLEDAEHYDIGAVVLKEERDLKQRLQKIKPSAISVGMLNRYIKKENKEGVLQSVEKSHKVDTSLNTEYVFEESDMKYGEKKSVKVELTGCEKYVSEKVPDEGSLTLDIVEKGFENLKKIYLVYEVFYVDKVKIFVSINQDTSTYEKFDRFPIGFKLIQYKLKVNGDIGATKTISNNKWRVFWLSKKKIRLPMDKLPPIPKEKECDVEKIDEPSECGRSND